MSDRSSGQRREVALSGAETAAMDALSEAAGSRRTDIIRCLDRREITARRAYDLIVADMVTLQRELIKILGAERYDDWSDGTAMALGIDRDAFIAANGYGPEVLASRVRLWLRHELPNFIDRHIPRISAALRRLRSA